MIHRLAASALGLVCVVAILFLVAFESRSVDFDGDWLYEDLTCGELASGYNFNVTMLAEVVRIHDECLAFSLSPADSGHGALHCALIKKEGVFVKEMANDIVAVYTAKRCGIE